MSSNSAPTLPKLILYTSHLSPWCHRVHIALHVLHFPFTEIIVPLGHGNPDKEWYINDINPRGLIPALKVETQTGEQHTIVESAIIVNFLIDLAHTLPTPHSTAATTLSRTPTSLETSLLRAKQTFFIDTAVTKVVVPLLAMLGASKSTADPAVVLKGIVHAISSELEPLLVNAEPFYGGSDNITVVEVMLGPFLVGLFALMDAGIVPGILRKALEGGCPMFWIWAMSVKGTKDVADERMFDGEGFVTRRRGMIKKAASQA